MTSILTLFPSIIGINLAWTNDCLLYETNSEDTLDTSFYKNVYVLNATEKNWLTVTKIYSYKSLKLATSKSCSNSDTKDSSYGYTAFLML